MCDIDTNSNNKKNNYLLNNIISTPNSPQQPPPRFQSKKVTCAIVDTGATSQYINSQAPCVNKRKLPYPTTVGLPNGNHLSGTEEAKLKLNLPTTVKRATIFPTMTNISLLSVETLCDAGMTATFTQ